ncbi:MAG: TPM domain-containing protein [Chitinophagaceae bacterium]|nr:TPM domain-containing protein [Chitinophagaceae bacterium]
MRKKPILIILSIAVAAIAVAFTLNYIQKKKLSIKNVVITQKLKSNTDNACATIIPNPSGYVNDFVHLFTEAQRWQLDSLIGLHEKQTTNQIALVTLDSSMLGTCNLADYTKELGNQWGVGQKEKNNGCVFAICVAPKKVRINNGYGIEKLITNAETQTIIDSVIIPNYKQEKLFEGTFLGLQKLMGKIGGK